MNIQTRKIEFIRAFLQIENEALISRLEEIIRTEKDEVKPMSLEEFNQRIDISLLDSKNDKVTESSNLIREIEQWN